MRRAVVEVTRVGQYRPRRGGRTPVTGCIVFGTSGRAAVADSRVRTRVVVNVRVVGRTVGFHVVRHEEIQELGQPVVGHETCSLEGHGVIQWDTDLRRNGRRCSGRRTTRST
jgi:hypothetical protein